VPPLVPALPLGEDGDTGDTDEPEEPGVVAEPGAVVVGGEADAPDGEVSSSSLEATPGLDAL
jgi:hypothetical protein